MATGRMLRSQISVSPQVNDLSLKAALLFTWLIPHVDDFGRLHADERRIKATIVPMREDIKIDDIKESLMEMYDQKLIVLYMIEDELYLQLTKFEKHQQGLHKRTSSKIPPPESANLLDSGKFPEIPGNSCLTEQNRTEENRTGTEQKNSSEAKKPASSPVDFPQDIFISIPLVDGSEFPIGETMVDEFQKCYPGVDVRQSLRSIRGWCISNPKKRKTRRGILRCVNGWLSDNQNKSGNMREQSFQPRMLNNYDRNTLVLEQIIREEEAKYGKQNLIDSGITHDHDG